MRANWSYFRSIASLFHWILIKYLKEYPYIPLRTQKAISPSKCSQFDHNLTRSISPDKKSIAHAQIYTKLHMRAGRTVVKNSRIFWFCLFFPLFFFHSNRKWNVHTDSKVNSILVTFNHNKCIIFWKSDHCFSFRFFFTFSFSVESNRFFCEFFFCHNALKKTENHTANYSSWFNRHNNSFDLFRINSCSL